MPAQPVKIILTGFGPFRDIRINPSYEVVKSMPRTLYLDDHDQPIDIQAYPEPITVTWDNVYNLVPEIYNKYVSKSGQEGQGLPFVIHVGAGFYGIYQVEKRAHRDGYTNRDEDGLEAPVQPEDDDDARSGKRGGRTGAGLMKRGFPIRDEHAEVELHTRIDVDGVVSDVRTDMPQLPMPVNRSDDAGRFLCDFIYYSSLYEAKKRFGTDGLGRVLFVHVPPDGTLEHGVNVLCSILKSIVRRSL